MTNEVSDFGVSSSGNIRHQVLSQEKMRGTLCWICVALSACAGAQERAPGVEVEPSVVTTPEGAPAEDVPREVPRSCLPQWVDSEAEPCATALPELAQRLEPAEAAARVELGDRAMAQESWEQCAEIFEGLASTHPEVQERVELARAAYICLEHIRDARRQERLRRRAPARPARDPAHDPRYQPRELTPLEERMVALASTALCLDPEHDDAAGLAYRRARLYYEANHWAISARLFESIAAAYPDHEVASYAVNLSLDCLNMLSTIDASRRETCRSALMTAVNRYLEVDRVLDDDELRYQLEQIQCQDRWYRAEELGENGAYDVAAQAFLALAGDDGGRCAELLRDRSCEALFNARQMYELGGRLESARFIQQRMNTECGPPFRQQ